VRRVGLGELRKSVEQLQRSLKVIGWRFEVPVNHGKTKLRACAGCPDNSETDHTLFGAEADAKNQRGFCMNGVCFKAKSELTEAVKVSVFNRVTKAKDQSKSAIEKKCPEWIRSDSVVGYVQRNLKKQASGNGAVKKTKSAAVPRSRERELTAHEQALVKFAKARDDWDQQLHRKLAEVASKDGLKWAMLCTLSRTQLFMAQEPWDVPRVNGFQKEPQTEEPMCSPASKKLLAAVFAPPALSATTSPAMLITGDPDEPPDVPDAAWK